MSLSRVRRGRWRTADIVRNAPRPDVRPALRWRAVFRPIVTTLCIATERARSALAHAASTKLPALIPAPAPVAQPVRAESGRRDCPHPHAYRQA